jgi:hypothetical protein
MNVTDQVWRDLAGPLYDDLVQSKKIAFAHLSDPNSNVRIAAIHICDRLWDGSRDDEFVNACRTLAVADPDDSVRVHAISSFGKALRSSRDLAASQFLADIVKDGNNSEKVRREAYWALREIQSGLTETDSIKRLVPLIKEFLHKFPVSMDEEQVKQALLCGGHFPEAIWNSTDQIDWDYVDQFASEK